MTGITSGSSLLSVTSLRTGLLVSLLSLTLACIGHRPPPPEKPPKIPVCANPNDTVTVEFLGASGFLIKHDQDVLMTAPFYSNPGLVRVGTGIPIHADEQRIREHGPKQGKLNGLRGVLIGHSHYDHLMDLPALLRQHKLDKAVTIYGSRTMEHLIHHEKLKTASVNAKAGTWHRKGEWITIPEGDKEYPFRVMAFHSEHGPHVLGMKLFEGMLEERPKHPPRNAYDWLEGQTFAYLIDVMADDQKTVLLRLHFQDAAANPPLGWVPRALQKERRVDVALLCAAAFAQVENYPEAILRDLSPFYAIPGHWENFFAAPKKEPRVVPLTHLDEFLVRMRSAMPEGHCQDDSCVPRTGDMFTFKVCAP